MKARVGFAGCSRVKCPHFFSEEAYSAPLWSSHSPIAVETSKGERIARHESSREVTRTANLTHRMRILIVDDNESVRRAIREVLIVNPSWNVCGEAADSEDALQKAQTLRPDIILLDMSMPGTDGLRTAHLLKKERPETRIVIMSQNDADILSAAAREAGASGCIDKMMISAESLVSILGGSPQRSDVD